MGNTEMTAEQAVKTLKAWMSPLFSAFPKSIINNAFEFIADPKTNTYFRLEDCMTFLDVQCKVIAWLSRAAYKTEYYSTRNANEKMHRYHLDGINAFLATNFTAEDMAIIYSELGNDVNRPLCVRFIESGYDMSVFGVNHLEQIKETN